MVWARKKDTSEEMSYLVGYYDKLSNLLDAIRVLKISPILLKNVINILLLTFC